MSGSGSQDKDHQIRAAAQHVCELYHFCLISIQNLDIMIDATARLRLPSFFRTGDRCSLCAICSSSNLEAAAGGKCAGMRMGSGEDTPSFRPCQECQDCHSRSRDSWATAAQIMQLKLNLIYTYNSTHVIFIYFIYLKVIFGVCL